MVVSKVRGWKSQVFLYKKLPIVKATATNRPLTGELQYTRTCTQTCTNKHAHMYKQTNTNKHKMHTCAHTCCTHAHHIFTQVIAKRSFFDNLVYSRAYNFLLLYFYAKHLENLIQLKFLHRKVYTSYSFELVVFRKYGKFGPK